MLNSTRKFKKQLSDVNLSFLNIKLIPYLQYYNFDKIVIVVIWVSI